MNDTMPTLYSSLSLGRSSWAVMGTFSVEIDVLKTLCLRLTAMLLALLVAALVTELAPATVLTLI